MTNIFKNGRIKFNELLTDAQNYLSSTYNQNNKTFTPASPFGQLLTVIIGLAQKIFYYIEDSVTELNINSATRESSIRGLASLTGYQPKNSTSAQGNVKVYYNGKGFIDEGVSNVILPNYTRVFTKFNNLPYLLVSNNETRFDANSSAQNKNMKIIQGEFFEEIFNGDGNPLQSLRLNYKYSEFIDLNSIRVFVNEIECTIYESIYDMPLGDISCILRNSPIDGIDIFFGNIYNGFIPPEGSLIRIQGIRNAGFAGNILDANNIKFEFSDTGFDNFGNSIDLNEYLEIIPENEITLGSNPEDINTIRLTAPIHSRSFVLSNIKAYESYIRRMNYFSTVDIFNTFDDDNLTDDNVVYMFLIPNLSLRIASNKNYFTSPMSSFLMSSDEQNQLIDKIELSGQVMIGTEFEIIQPNIKRFVLFVIIDFFKGYSKELIRAQIIDSLSTYFINQTRRDRIPKSDLIAIIEGINGVDSVNVYFKSDPNNSISGDDTYLNDMGDIIIGKRDYPLIRGGWVDPDNNISYLNDLSESALSSLNIQFNQEVTFDTNRANNKNVVNSIRKRTVI